MVSEAELREREITCFRERRQSAVLLTFISLILAINEWQELAET